MEERRGRPIFISFIMILLSVGLMYYYIEDAIFFFTKPEPIMLGDADKLSIDKLKHNTYVSISGIPDPRMIRGDTYVYFFFTKTYNYYMFMGNASILIKEPVEANRNRREEGLETGPRIGRFITFKKYPNPRELSQAREFFTKRLNRRMDDNGGVIIVGERPYKDLLTLVIYLILLAVLIYNLRNIYRRFVSRRREQRI